jgi:competence protein ComEC
MTLSKIRIESLNTVLLKESHKNVLLEGVIYSIKNNPHKQNTAKIILEQIDCQTIKNLSKLTLNIGKEKTNDLSVNDTVTVIADLFPHPDRTSPYSLDFKRAGFFQGISGTGKVKKITSIKKRKRYSLELFRFHLTNNLKEKLTLINGAIAAALVTGDRSSIPLQISQSFVDSGVAHILSISGLHMAIIVSCVFFISRRLLCLWPKLVLYHSTQLVAFFLAFFVSALYMIIAGGGYPVIRSFLMTSFFLFGILFKRRPISMRSVALATLVIFCFYPESLFSVSFQLSFSAVVALIGGYEMMSHRIFFKNRFFNYVVGLFLSTFWATLATTPFVLETFQRSTLQSLLGNLLAVPLTSFWIMPNALFAVVSLLFGGSSFLFYLLDKGISYLVHIVLFISSMPGSAITVEKPPAFFLPLVLLGGIWLFLFVGRFRYVGLFPVCLSFVLWFFFPRDFPTVYVSPGLIAYREQKKFYVSTLKGFDFERQVWMKENNIKEESLFPQKFLKIKDCYFSYFLIPSYSIRYFKRYFEKNLSKQDCHLLITNGYLIPNSENQTSVLVDKLQLKQNKNCFIWIKNNTQNIEWGKSRTCSHPWCF